MSNLKCPFCQQEYIITKDDFCFGQQRCVCRNPKCEFDGWHFPVRLVSELIRTRKALGMASDCMKIMYDNLPDGNRWKWEIEKTLEQIKITMQEQPNDN